MCAGGLLLALAGCSSGSPDAPAAREPLVKTDEVVEVLDAEIESLRTNELAFEKCVGEAGFDYTVRSVSVTYPDTETFPTDLDLQRQFGYGIVDGEGNTGVVVEISGGAVPAEQQGAFDEFMSGPNECGQYQRNVDLQELALELTSDPLSEEEFVAISGQPEFVDAMNKWSECMHDKGYQFATPADAFDSIEGALSELDSGADDYQERRAEVLELEIQTASADADCFEAHVDPVVTALREES